MFFKIVVVFLALYSSANVVYGGTVATKHSKKNTNSTSRDKPMKGKKKDDSKKNDFKSTSSSPSLPQELTTNVKKTASMVSAVPVVSSVPAMSPRVEQIICPVVGIIVSDANSGTTDNSDDKVDGSGFIVDPEGFIVTNNHVIEGASRIEVVLYDGSRYAATVVGNDASSDIALLKIDTAGRKLIAVIFADSDEVEITTQVYAVGNPFGFGTSVTSGIISSKLNCLPNQVNDIRINIPFLQTDAPINYGNSGGPLTLHDGRVVGMVTVFVTEGSQNTGISFAIPSNLLKRVIDQLKVYGKLRRSWVGFLAVPLGREVESALGLNRCAFAVVFVEKGSPADMAEICPGDLILSVNNENMHPNTNLEYLLTNLPIGELIPVVAVRSKQEVTFNVRVGLKDDSDPLLESEGQTEQPPIYKSIDCLSIGVADLNKDIRERYGIPNNIDGVLIAHVGKRPSKMSEGNVILSVNQKRVTHVSDITEKMNDLTSSKASEVVLEVYDTTRSIPWFFVKFALIYGTVSAAPVGDRTRASTKESINNRVR